MANSKSALLRIFMGSIYGALVFLFLFLSFPVYIVRYFVSLLAKTLRPDLGDILNGQSCLFVTELFRSHPLRSNIIVCLTVEGSITLEELQGLVQKNWIQATNSKTGQLVYERFQQYAVNWVGFTFYIVRYFVSLLAKTLRPDLGDILNGQSCLFVTELFRSHPLRSNIIVCLTVEGSITLEELQGLVQKNWIQATNSKTGQLVYERFQQYAVNWVGFTFYKKAYDTFDIRNHVHFHESFGGPYVSEQDVTNFTEKLVNARYRPKTSPWEIHLVHNYRNPKISSNTHEMCLLILKVHHSLADGYSILSALVEGLFELPLSEMKMPMPRFPKKSLLEKIFDWVKFPLLLFYESSYTLGQSLQPSPWKVPDRKKEWHNFCVKSDLIPIENVKTIKNTFKVSFSSVLMSAMSSAISQQLETKRRRGEIVEGDDGSMFSMSPLPIPGHSLVLTNHLTAALFNIPTTNFGDPLERLRRCHGILESCRSSVIPYMARYMTTLVGWHFAPVVAFLSKNRMISTGFTNFPALPVISQKDGRNCIICDFVTGGMQGDAGAAVATLSYDRWIRLAISAEKAIMTKEETSAFVQNMTNEINLLYARAISSQRPLST